MATTPFLKWAGGKRWLAPRLASLLGQPLNARLVEPFLGSGAVFFALCPSSALLGDTNEELVATYRAIQSSAAQVVGRLSSFEITSSAFDRVKLSKPRADIGRATRLIYLNRTAFNGLYRVNKEGIFNVPFGCKRGTQPCDVDVLLSASEALANATIICQGFKQTLQRVSPLTDVLYIDPPYTVKHNNNGFRRYNEQIFSWQDQKDLAERLTTLASRGMRIVVSNANHDAVRELYSRSLFHRFELSRRSSMAADPAMRGPSSELLLVSKAVCQNRRTIVRKLELGR